MTFIDWLTASAIACTIIYLGSAAYALHRRAYRTRSGRLSLLYALLGALWALEQAVRPFGLLNALDQGFLGRLPVYGLVLLGLVFLLLTRSMVGINTSGWPWLILGLAGLAVPIAIDARLLAIVENLYLGGGTISRDSLLAWIPIATWAILMAGAAGYTVRSVRHTSRYHTLVSYWAIVLVLSILGNGLYAAGLQYPGLRLPGLWLATAGSLLAVVVAVAPRLPEINRVFRQWLSKTLYVASGVLAYTVLFSLAHFWLREPFGDQSIWIGLAAAAIAMVLVDPLLTRLRRSLRRWAAGEQQSSTELLRHYSQSITNILDLNLLATVVVGTVSEIMDVKRGFVFLVDYEKGQDGHNQYQVRGVKGMGETNPIPCRLREESPLANYFRCDYKPLTYAAITSQPRFKGMYDEEVIWLEQIGVDILVPIFAKNEWIGLLALGSKSSGRGYTNRELTLLSTIADQTAVALENIRLVEGLVRLNNDFRRAYTALDQANRNLERLDKTKSDFISISSHELRTPLTLISGASQMLLDDPDLQKNPYYKQMLTKMHTGTIRLHEIVDTMLDVAKIDTRALELEPQPISLSNLVRAVCNDLRKDIEERKQILEIQDLEDLPSITADAQALRKVFYHVIVNAIKYTPDHGKITIWGEAVMPNTSDLRNGGVEVVVHDTGIGIDPRFQELIFTKFYQTGELALHSSGKTKFKGGGPGLGLAIARGIVEAHRGKIWVESSGYSEENCPGSSFHILLPLRPPSA